MTDSGNKLSLKASIASTREGITQLISNGYQILGAIFSTKNVNLRSNYNAWLQESADLLERAFPTQKERGEFLFKTGNSYSYNNIPEELQNVMNGISPKLHTLEHILDTLETHYTYRKPGPRIFINEIDSFNKVRNVNHQQIQHLLKNGEVDVDEEQVKKSFAEIIGEAYVPADWGGETEDLTTTRVLLNGERIKTAVIFKGPGTKKSDKVAHISHFGKNGDQIIRMIRSSDCDLYIIQTVKPVAKDVEQQAEAEILKMRAEGKECQYCIIDGQDTATILFAYGYTK